MLSGPVTGDSYLAYWYNANFDTVQLAFDYQYFEKAVRKGLASRVSPEQYTRDALYFRSSYQGRWQPVVLEDGTGGWKGRGRHGNGGIYSQDERIVSYWYR